jgi:ketosteroid isomerase-like protein
MSEENVEVVRRMYEAFHGGAADAALSYFDPEVVVDASIRVDGGIGHGRQELNTIIGKWIGAFDDWREEIEEIRDLGDMTLVISTQRGRGKGSGIEVEDRYAILYELKADKITRLTMYTDPAMPSKPPGCRRRPLSRTPGASPSMETPWKQQTAADGSSLTRAYAPMPSICGSKATERSKRQRLRAFHTREVAGSKPAARPLVSIRSRPQPGASQPTSRAGPRRPRAEPRRDWARR